MTDSKLEVGKRYVIVGSEGGHKFPLGAEVRVLDKSNLATTSPDNDPPFKLGVTAYICPSDVRPVDNEPQPGDRVRVTSVVDAVVAQVYPGGFQVEGPQYFSQVPDNEIRTVEILERAPKPFKTGTVVLSGGNPLVRFRDGRWLSPNIERNHGFDRLEGLTDQYIRDSGYEIVYEPSQSA